MSCNSIAAIESNQDATVFNAARGRVVGVALAEAGQLLLLVPPYASLAYLRIDWSYLRVLRKVLRRTQK
jgi:hypothetical protein